MAGRSGIDGALQVVYSTVNILEVSSVFEASCVRISKVGRHISKVSMVGRNGIESALHAEYSTVDILEVTSMSEAKCIQSSKVIENGRIVKARAKCAFVMRNCRSNVINVSSLFEVGLKCHSASEIRELITIIALTIALTTALTITEPKTRT